MVVTRGKITYGSHVRGACNTLLYDGRCYKQHLTVPAGVLKYTVHGAYPLLVVHKGFFVLFDTFRCSFETQSLGESDIDTPWTRSDGDIDPRSSRFLSGP